MKPSCLRLGNALGLAKTQIRTVLASDCSENIEHHRVHRVEDAGTVFVDERREAHDVGRSKVTRTSLASITPPSRASLWSEARQPVSLLYQQHVSRLTVGQQAEQLRPIQLSPTLIFNIARLDPECSLNSESVQRSACA